MRLLFSWTKRKKSSALRSSGEYQILFGVSFCIHSVHHQGNTNFIIIFNFISHIYCSRTKFNIPKNCPDHHIDSLSHSLSNSIWRSFGKLTVLAQYLLQMKMRFHVIQSNLVPFSRTNCYTNAYCCTNIYLHYHNR